MSTDKKLRGFVGTGDLYFSGALRGDLGSRGWFVDPRSWVVTDSLHFEHPNALEIASTSISIYDAAVIDQDVWIGSGSAEYAFWKFDDAGELITVVSRAVDYLRNPGVAQMGSATGYMRLSTVAPAGRLPTGELLVFTNWMDVRDPGEYARQAFAQEAPDVDQFHSMDLFDEEGRYIASRRGEGSWPDLGRIHAITPNGKLYTSLYAPYPQVRRYRIIRE